MIRSLLTTILFMFVLFKCGLSEPDLCRNPKIDSIAYLSNEEMFFFTSGGYYWFIKKSEFPPKPNSGKPLPEGFKRGDAAVYKDTLTVCSATGKPAEQEIYVLEKTEKGNQIMVFDTRTKTWSRPVSYNTDKTISVAQIDWNKNVDAIFTYKPTEMYFVQGIKISVINYRRICRNPEHFAEPITIRPTDDIGTRHPIDAMTLIANDRFVYFTGNIYHEMKINTAQSSNGKLMVYKELQKNISKHFFQYNECPEEPTTQRPDENTSKQPDDTPEEKPTLEPIPEPSHGSGQPPGQEPIQEPGKDPNANQGSGGGGKSNTALYVIIGIVVIVIIGVIVIFALYFAGEGNKSGPQKTAAPKPKTITRPAKSPAKSPIKK